MSNTFGTQHQPVEIKSNREDKTLEIDFDDGKTFCLTAELLRVESPSADVQGHGPGQKTVVQGRRHVGIMEIEPIGNYAIKIKFDDLHDSGIFTWDLLYDYGQRQDEIWANYLNDLKDMGYSRDP